MTNSDTSLSDLSAGRFSEAVLEFPSLVELLRGFLTGSIAGPLVDAIRPSTEAVKIRDSLDLVRDATGFARESSRPSLSALQDPRPILGKLSVEGLSLTAQEILALLELARAAREAPAAAAAHGARAAGGTRGHTPLGPNPAGGGAGPPPRELPRALAQDDPVSLLPEVGDPLAEAEGFCETRRADHRDRGAALE